MNNATTPAGTPADTKAATPAPKGPAMPAKPASRPADGKAQASAPAAAAVATAKQQLTGLLESARAARERATGDNAAAMKLQAELRAVQASLDAKAAELATAASEIEALNGQLKTSRGELESALNTSSEQQRTITALQLEVRILRGTLDGDLQQIISEVTAELRAIADLPDPMVAQEDTAIMAPPTGAADEASPPMTDPLLDHHEVGPAPKD